MGDVQYVVGGVWADDCTADLYCVVAAGKSQSGVNWIVVEHVETDPSMRTAGPEVELLLIEEAFCRFKHLSAEPPRP